MDVHLRMGIDDHWVRLGVADHRNLLNCWILAGEDVVLRCVYEASEVDIVLRGTSSGYVKMMRADPNKRIPTYNVVRTADMRRSALVEAGLPEGG